MSNVKSFSLVSLSKCCELVGRKLRGVGFKLMNMLSKVRRFKVPHCVGETLSNNPVCGVVCDSMVFSNLVAHVAILREQ